MRSSCCHTAALGGYGQGLDGKPTVLDTVTSVACGRRRSIMVPCRAPGPCCGTVQPVPTTAVVEHQEIQPNHQDQTYMLACPGRRSKRQNHSAGPDFSFPPKISSG